jgi:hypothetical protein
MVVAIALAGLAGWCVISFIWDLPFLLAIYGLIPWDMWSTSDSRSLPGVLSGSFLQSLLGA